MFYATVPQQEGPGCLLEKTRRLDRFFVVKKKKQSCLFYSKKQLCWCEKDALLQSVVFCAG